MASSSEVLPEPLGPMMPVMPSPNTISVSACWRKLTSRSRCSFARRHRAIDVPDEQAHDLVVDLGAPHAFGDLRVELFRVEPRGADRRQIDMTPRRRDRTEGDARARELDEEIAFAVTLRLLLLGLVLE